MKEVLKLVRDGNLLSKAAFADELGIQESTLDNVFSLLSLKGYLRKFDGTTQVPPACVGCSISKKCMQNVSAGNVYVITDKGKRYLEEN
jgi:hypothetical protein